jgi:hypothetical protein
MQLQCRGAWRRNFCGCSSGSCSATHINVVDKVLPPYAAAIADAQEDEVTRWRQEPLCLLQHIEPCVRDAPLCCNFLDIRAVCDCKTEHQPQPERAGSAPRRSRQQAYNVDTLHQSSGKYRCHWLVVIQLTFNLLTIITCVFR